MDTMSADWTRLFANETSPAELVARGSILYVAMLVVLRLLPRRTGGGLAVMDLVLAVLLADAAARALGDYRSITDALIVIVTIAGWNYLLNLLSFHVRFVERLVSPSPLQVVKDGRLLWRNMRSELLTKEELMDHLRQEGVDSLDQVKAAYIESEGKLTVICK